VRSSGPSCRLIDQLGVILVEEWKHYQARMWFFCETKYMAQAGLETVLCIQVLVELMHDQHQVRSVVPSEDRARVQR